MSKSKKLITSAVAALVLAGSVASATPAFAWHHHHHHGYGWAPYAAGAAGALALGAIAAGAASGPDCYYERRPIFNRWGNVIGYRNVPVC